MIVVLENTESDNDIHMMPATSFHIDIRKSAPFVYCTKVLSSCLTSRERITMQLC